MVLERMRRRAALVARGEVDGLLAAARDGREEERAFALETLAWMRDRRSLDAAVAASRRGEPRPVRSAAIRLLGALGARERLREILAEPLERVSPYETSTDWIHVQAEYALEVPWRAPAWDPSAWNTARIGSPAPHFRFERPTTLLFLLADW